MILMLFLKFKSVNFAPDPIPDKLFSKGSKEPHFS